MGQNKGQTRSQPKQARTATSRVQQPFQVQDVLYTNHVTTPLERPSISASRLEHQQDVNDINQLISQHTTFIESLVQRRDDVLQIIEHHNKLLRPSPMRSIPVEILSHIFESFAASSDTQNAPQLRTRVTLSVRPFCSARMLLLCVCRRWREVAIATPRLWRVFYIRSGQMRYDEDIGARWLQSAASIPLSLAYSVDDCSGGLQLVTRELHRCQDLQLKFEAPTILAHLRPEATLLSQLSPLGATLLTTLTVVSSVWNHDFFHKWTPAFMCQLPRLTSLTTDMPAHYLEGLAEAKSLHLTIVHSINVNEVIAYLDTLPKLDRLTLDYLMDGGSRLLSEWRYVLHRHLRSLHCLIHSQNEENHLFDRLTLPLLEDLDINTTARFSFQSLKRLLTRSSCKITSLSFCFQRPDWSSSHLYPSQPSIADGWVDLLRLDQIDKHLERLRLVVYPGRIDHADHALDVLGDSCLSFLKERNSLPRLTHLRFAASDKEGDMVAEILRRRITECDGQAKLKHLILHHQVRRYKDDEPNYLDGFWGRGTVIDFECVPISGGSLPTFAGRYMFRESLAWIA